MKTELWPVNPFTKQIAAVVKHLFGKKEISTHKIKRRQRDLYFHRYAGSRRMEQFAKDDQSFYQKTKCETGNIMICTQHNSQYLKQILENDT